jgi:hypothetical protein
MVRCIQLPGRDVLIAGGIITLLTVLVMTSSAHLTSLGAGRQHTHRQELLGTVRYQGELIPAGRILFLCQIVEPEMETIDAKADIVGGQFHIPKADGPMPGWFLIRVMVDGMTSNEKIARPLVVCHEYGNGPIRVPAGSDLFVRLNLRRVNRFDIDFQPAAPSTSDVASL